MKKARVGYVEILVLVLVLCGLCAKAYWKFAAEDPAGDASATQASLAVQQSLDRDGVAVESYGVYPAQVTDVYVSRAAVASPADFPKVAEVLGDGCGASHPFTGGSEASGDLFDDIQDLSPGCENAVSQALDSGGCVKMTQSVAPTGTAVTWEAWSGTRDAAHGEQVACR